MRALKLVGCFIRTSLQEEAAYRANFWISLFYSVLNLGSGVLGIVVLFGQVESVQGWTLPSTLALLENGLTLVVVANPNMPAAAKKWNIPALPQRHHPKKSRHECPAP